MPELIFVSYAESDNDEKFVDDFINILDNSLRLENLLQKKGYQFAFYRETEPRDTAPLTPREIQELGTATFFIAITSPQYVASKHCGLQREYFIEHRVKHSQNAESPVQMIEVEMADPNPDNKPDVEKILEPLQVQRGSFLYKLWSLYNQHLQIADCRKCRYKIEVIATEMFKRTEEFVQIRQAIAQIYQQTDHSDKFIFIDAAPPDRVLAEQIKNSLNKFNIKCVFPITLTRTGKFLAQEITTDLEQNIKNCTAMLIVRGAGIPRAWIEQHYRHYQKMKSGRAQPVDFLAICEEKPDPLLNNIIEDEIPRVSCSPVNLEKFIAEHHS